MAVSAASAARTVCELRGWSVSNLEIQKILYLAHMYHLGRTNGEPLIGEAFEAWDYGPVLPTLYHRLKMFGGSRVRDVFGGAREIQPGSPEYESIREAVEGLQGQSAGELVAQTHWNGGAWAKRYVPAARGMKIPDYDILAEYRARTANG